MQELILVEDVGKSYFKKPVFNNINISINKNEAIAIMGKNGSGKSTLLKIIAGVLACSEGKVIYNAKPKISYMPDKLPKLPFKVEDYLFHMGKIQGLSKREISCFIDAKFEFFDIEQSIKTQKISNCSKGTMQKINILQATLGKPDLLVMDEPFSGLDEKSQQKLIALLKNLLNDEVTVIATCHERALAKELTDSIYVLENQLHLINNEHLDYYIIKFMVAPLNEISKFNMGELLNIKKENHLYIAEAKKCDLEKVLVSLIENGCEVHSVNLK